MGVSSHNAFYFLVFTFRDEINEYFLSKRAPNKKKNPALFFENGTFDSILQRSGAQKLYPTHTGVMLTQSIHS